jgi:hypothetical protein
MIGRVDEFVPGDFDVPRRLETPQFVLEPLGPEHNDQDYDAWTSSREHIHATPGWEDSSWPREMTPDENRADLQRHADDFRNRTGFTYTVLDPGSRDVIGCVYIYRMGAERLAVHPHAQAPGRRARRTPCLQPDRDLGSPRRRGFGVLPAPQPRPPDVRRQQGTGRRRR